MDKTSLGDRMKQYEGSSRFYFPWRMPLIIRVDGRAFHTLTRGLEKPWDGDFVSRMYEAAEELFKIAGCRFAYVQSDEISLVLTDYDRLETQPWFGKNLQKVVSISASIATRAFNKGRNERLGEFDSRAFVLPREEVVNYFVWRQQDCVRNSISGLAQSHFSARQLHGKSQSAMLSMLLECGIDWNEVKTRYRHGVGVYKKDGMTHVDYELPLFVSNRSLIGDLIEHGEEESGKKDILVETESELSKLAEVREVAERWSKGELGYCRDVDMAASLFGILGKS